MDGKSADFYRFFCVRLVILDAIFSSNDENGDCRGESGKYNLFFFSVAIFRKGEMVMETDMKDRRSFISVSITISPFRKIVCKLPIFKKTNLLAPEAASWLYGIAFRHRI
jgi:hypothetical protein